jgi:hypothetical protein
MINMSIYFPNETKMIPESIFYITEDITVAFFLLANYTLEIKLI